MNNISPQKIVLLASTISIEITKDKSIDELNAYKNLFSLISSNISAICQQKALNKVKNTKN